MSATHTPLLWLSTLDKSGRVGIMDATGRVVVANRPRSQDAELLAAIDDHNSIARAKGAA